MRKIRFCALILLAILGSKFTTATNAHARFDTKLKKDLETCRQTVCSSFSLDEGLQSAAFIFSSVLSRSHIITPNLVKCQSMWHRFIKLRRHELCLQMRRWTVLWRGLQCRTYRRWRNRLPPLQTVYFVCSQGFTDSSACGEQEALIGSGKLCSDHAVRSNYFVKIDLSQIRGIQSSRKLNCSSLICNAMLQRVTHIELIMLYL